MRRGLGVDDDDSNAGDGDTAGGVASQGGGDGEEEEAMEEEEEEEEEEGVGGSGGGILGGIRDMASSIVGGSRDEDEDDGGGDDGDALDPDDEGLSRFAGSGGVDQGGEEEPALDATASTEALSPEAQAAQAAQRVLLLQSRAWLKEHPAATTEELLASLSEFEAGLSALEPPEPEPDSADAAGQGSEGLSSGGGGSSSALSGAELQHAVLSHFYAKYAPKSSVEVTAILEKRRGADAELSESAFDALCDKLEDKYGESPQKMWALDSVMSDDEEAEDDNSAASGAEGSGLGDESSGQEEIDWDAVFDEFDKSEEKGEL
jgi:hypothetical protein